MRAGEWRGPWRRAFIRLALYGAAWTAVLVLSWFTAERGRALGGTAAWAGILHPLVFGLTAWRVLLDFVRGKRWFTIPNAVLGLTYLAIGLGSVHFVLRYEALSYDALRRPEEVRAALLVATAGIVAYRVGVEGPWFKRWVRRLPRLPSTPSWSWGVRVGFYAAVGVALASQIYLASRGSLGYLTADGAIRNTGLGSILTYASRIGLLALAGAYFYWFSGERLARGDRICLIGATGIIAVIAVTSGMKEEFLLVVFAVAIPYLWTRSRAAARRATRTKEVAFASAVVVAMLALFALNPLYRSVIQDLRTTESRIDQASAALDVVLTQVASGEGTNGSLVVAGAERAWSRLATFPYHLAVVDQVPDRHSYRGFDRYPLLPAMTLIPRALWAEKPQNSSGTDFQRRFISDDVVNSTTPTVYGWTYVEAGWIGVVAVLFGLGLLTGVVERYLAEQQAESLAALVGYTALFLVLAEIEADPFWQLGGIVKMLAVAGAGYALLTAVPLLLRRPGQAGAQFEAA